MDGVWVTYAEAAARLNVSVEAVRQRAIRNRWARTLGNDKRARVRLPDEPYPTQTPIVRSTEPALLDALREHNETLKGEVELLKGQLVTERERADRAMAEFAGERAAHQEQLTAARAAADKATAELVELARRLAAIAETQTSAKPEPPRHWAIRAWRWAQKTA
jgi:hypothetical protein